MLHGVYHNCYWAWPQLSGLMSISKGTDSVAIGEWESLQTAELNTSIESAATLTTAPAARTFGYDAKMRWGAVAQQDKTTFLPTQWSCVKATHLKAAAYSLAQTRIAPFTREIAFEVWYLAASGSTVLLLDRMIHALISSVLDIARTIEKKLIRSFDHLVPWHRNTSTFCLKKRWILSVSIFRT